MQNPTVLIRDNDTVIQILAMILVEFCCLLFFEGLFLDCSFNDLICLLEVISCISLHLWIAATLLVPTQVVDLLVRGQAARLRFHLAVSRPIRVSTIRAHDKRGGCTAQA